jgi:nucleoside-diphosphate-sugar epimerase
VVDDRAAGRIYNVGETPTPTVAERVRRVGELAGWSGRVVVVRSDRLPQHLRAPYQPRQDLVMDSSRIRDELGWVEACSMDEGIRRTIEWERANELASGDPGAAEYAAEDAASIIPP